MNETMNYIFGSMRRQETAARRAALALARQSRATGVLTVLVIFSISCCVVMKDELNEQKKRIGKLSAEVEKLKNAGCECRKAKGE